MKHRLFIASHLPDSLKKEFLVYQQEKLFNACFRLVPEQDLHLTLIFIGDIWNNELFKVIQACEDVVKLFLPIKIEINKITYGPTLYSSRLVWVEGKYSEELNELHQRLEKKLINKGIKFKIENRLFKPHITLARINKNNFNKIALLEDIEMNLEKSFLIKKISIIESELKRQGSQYTNLNTFLLKP